jgi:hypothetical protein
MLQEAFLRFETSPLFQMLFLWLNKTPPEWSSPLSFSRGFWDRYQFEILLSQIKWNIDTNWYQFILKFFEMVVQSFCFGLNIFSPFDINRQKWRTLKPFCNFIPLWGLIPSPKWWNKYEWRSYLLGTCSQMLWVKNKATQRMLNVKVLRPSKHYFP